MDMVADSDRISELPDEILLHILSFLPTEDVVVASLVSKRWKPLWFSVTTMDFDQEKFYKRRPENQQQKFGFANFVRAATKVGGLHPPIKRFRLDCDDETLHANQWLNDVIQRGVENLEINSYRFQLPRNIFNCTTLVVLKLCWPSFCNVCSSVYLPSLKTLNLKHAEFFKPQYFMDFLYGCPILQNLDVYHACFCCHSFEGEFKTLSKLVKAQVCGLERFHIPVKVFSNVEFLSLDKCDDEDIPIFPNLIHLKLLDVVKIKSNSVLGILNCSPNLQIFFLHYRDLSYEDWPIPQFATQCFSLQLKKCVIANYAGWPNQTRVAKYVMQNSTSLRTMTIICSNNYPGCNDHCKEELASSCPRTCKLLFK